MWYSGVVFFYSVVFFRPPTSELETSVPSVLGTDANRNGEGRLMRQHASNTERSLFLDFVAALYEHWWMSSVIDRRDSTRNCQKRAQRQAAVRISPPLRR